MIGQKNQSHWIIFSSSDCDEPTKLAYWWPYQDILHDTIVNSYMQMFEKVKILTKESVSLFMKM